MDTQGEPRGPSGPVKLIIETKGSLAVLSPSKAGNGSGRTRFANVLEEISKLISNTLRAQGTAFVGSGMESL